MENIPKKRPLRNRLVLNLVLCAAALALISIAIFGAVRAFSAKQNTPSGQEGSGEKVTAKQTYQNKKSITQIGDPFVFYDEKTERYYMTATAAGDGFDLYSTTDFQDWKAHGAVLSVGSENMWATREMWGPEIITKEGKYYLFYSGRWDQNDSPRIGVAVANEVTGPYRELLGKPLFDFGYAVIDNHYFRDDDGQEYLYYSRDCSENIVDGVHESQLYVVRLSPDFQSVEESEGTFCTRPQLDWELQSGNEWRWNEAPWMMKHDGKYYLMYSGNYFGDRSYSIGYAIGSSPKGPFVKPENNLLVSAEYNEISGPGNNSVFLSPDKKEFFTAYHLHTDPQKGGGDRYLNIDRLGFRSDGTLYINGPTVSPQPLPSGALDGMALISSEARASASSVKDGYTASGVNDGEIGIYKANERYEWAAKGETTGAYVTLSWDEEKTVHSVFIYGSALIDRKCQKVSVTLSTGDVVDGVVMPTLNGEAAVVNFPGGVRTSSVKVTITETGFGQKEAGISEMMVFGE